MSNRKPPFPNVMINRRFTKSCKSADHAQCLSLPMSIGSTRLHNMSKNVAKIDTLELLTAHLNSFPQIQRPLIQTPPDNHAPHGQLNQPCDM